MRTSLLRLKTVLLIADLAVAPAALALASALRFGPRDQRYWDALFPDPLLPLLLYTLVWVLVLAACGAYRPGRLWPLRQEAALVVRAAALFALLILALLTAFKIYNVSRLFLLLAFTLQPALALFSRVAVRAALGRLRAAGGNPRHLLIAGAGERGRAFARELARHPELGLRVIGFLDDDPGKRGSRWEGVPVLGGLDRLPGVLAEHVVDEVVVALPFDAFDRIRAVVAACEAQGKNVHLMADALETRVARSRVSEFNGLPLLSLVSGPDAPLALACKRIIDVAGAAVLLAAFSPVMLAVAVAVKLTSPGPVLFRQRRVGLHGRLFTLYKFRSMVADAEARLRADRRLYEMYQANGFKVPAEQDPRITPLGRFLRKTSLDELPQLWNVLKGDMSLVGPRPIVPSELGNYDGLRAAYLSMRPGVTGYWQVSGRSEVDYPDRVACDLHYVLNWTFVMDLVILLNTIPAVLRQRGAY